MRPSRILVAVSLAALAVAVSGCGARTAVHPSAAATPTQPTVTGPAAAPTPTIPRTPPPSTPPPSQPVACRTGQLQLLTGRTEGAMGHRYVTYGLRNRSAVACSMSGFPGVQLLDAHGGDLPTVLRHSNLGTGPAGRVLLRPGGWGFFVVEEGVIPYDTDVQPCPAAATIAVTPPHQRQALTVPTELAPCGGRLSVSPVGPTGELTQVR
jgi:hypothetical protein